MNKQGRNKLCDCGSGKKYKVCHGRIDKGLNQQWMIIFAIGLLLGKIVLRLSRIFC